MKNNLQFHTNHRNRLSILSWNRRTVFSLQTIPCTTLLSLTTSIVVPLMSLISSNHVHFSTSSSSITSTSHTHKHSYNNKPSINNNKSTISPTIVTINKFSDFTPWIKRCILRIHPDIIATYPSEYIENNEESLTHLFFIIENLNIRCGINNDNDNNNNDGKNTNPANNNPSSTSAGKLNNQYTLRFYYERTNNVSSSSSSTTPLHQCTIPINIPTALETSYQQQQIRNEKDNTLPIEIQYQQLEWLLLTLDIIQKLTSGIELPVKFSLSIELQEKYLTLQKQITKTNSSKDIFNNSKFTSKYNENDPFEYINPQDATQQLITNLAKFSPILQGKTPYRFPSRGLDKESVYTLKQRTTNIDRILSRANYVEVLTNQGISKLEAAQAMSRLRTLFITYHDVISAYHAIWSKIRITIGPAMNNHSKNNMNTIKKPIPIKKLSSGSSTTTMTYYADVNTLSFYLPLDFDDTITINLLEKYLPRMINYGRQSLPKHQLNKLV